MLKVKVNLKKKDPLEVIHQPPPQEKLTLQNLKKVIAYDDVEEPIHLSPKVEIGLKKIQLKAKINYTPLPIKITQLEEEEEDYSNLEEPISDSDDEKVMSPPVVIQIAPMLVKLNLKKTETVNVIYKSQLLDQKPILKVGIVKPKLTGQIDLETYYDDSTMYFIHRDTGLIFPSDTHLKDQLPESIGRLVWDECKHGANIKEDDDEKVPLVRQHIEWFHYYELDVDAQE